MDSRQQQDSSGSKKRLHSVPREAHFLLQQVALLAHVISAEMHCPQYRPMYGALGLTV